MTGNNSGQDNYINRNYNPSAEFIVSKFIDKTIYINKAESIYNDDKSNEYRVIVNCKEKLALIKDALLPAYHKRKKIFLAWDLLHQLDSELIQIQCEEELHATYNKIITEIKNSSMPESSKKDWLNRLENINELFETGKIDGSCIKMIRQTLSSALNALNSLTDNMFWDIWCKKMFSASYLLMMLLLTFCYLIFSHFSQHDNLVLFVIYLGALGGLWSGVFSSDIQPIAYGQFGWPLTYYILVRPIQGALAATMVYLMIQSQFLIVIDPPVPSTWTQIEYVQLSTPVIKSGIPLNEEKVAEIINKVSEKRANPEKGEYPGSKGMVPANATNGTSSQAVKETARMLSQNASASLNATTPSLNIRLQAAPGYQHYLLFLILLVAGFSGDKILRSVTDKVMSKLFADAEKTQSAQK